MSLKNGMTPDHRIFHLQRSEVIPHDSWYLTSLATSSFFSFECRYLSHLGAAVTFSLDCSSIISKTVNVQPFYIWNRSICWHYNSTGRSNCLFANPPNKDTCFCTKDRFFWKGLVIRVLLYYTVNVVSLLRDLGEGSICICQGCQWEQTPMAVR